MMPLIHVYGRVANGPTMHRAVTPIEFVRLWGPYAAFVRRATLANPLIVGDRTVWIEYTEEEAA